MYNRNLIDYLPKFLRNIREYKAILTEAVQPEVVELFNAVENAMNDQFITDATENGISRWEKMLKIVPKANPTLDDRKFTILTKMSERLPYTMASLEKRLEALCGENGYSVELDSDNFLLIVRIALSAQNAFKDVCEMLEKVVPANMVINVSLLYNKNEALCAYTHGQLGVYTHEQLRNEVVNNG